MDSDAGMRWTPHVTTVHAPRSDVPTPRPTDPPHIDDALVRDLVADRFPAWSGLPLRRWEPAGSDNVIYRLGDDLSVRLPRGEWAAGQAVKEHRWLPGLAARLPLAIPAPVGLGEPALGYPWHWSVSQWLPGTAARTELLTDPQRAARDLAGFLTTLWETPLPGQGSDDAAPTAEGLARRDRATRDAITATADRFDAAALTRVWEAALATTDDRAPRWVHGDMHDGNLLVVDGRLSAVIDFGGLAAGDPACDLVVAWTLFDAAARDTFRSLSGVDDATWTRGRGWAIATGLNAYTAYAAVNPRVAAATHRQITRAAAG
ncbi:aminoglycoside phosphotransferase family protein [Stackebrandtia albiflava]